MRKNALRQRGDRGRRIARMTVPGASAASEGAGFSATGTTWLGHRRGTSHYRRILFVMLLAGVATFAQLYAPQAMLHYLSLDFAVPISSAALMVSAGTAGLAVMVVPWSLVADRIGRRRAITLAVAIATACSVGVAFSPWFALALAFRLLEGAALAGVPAAALAYINEEVHPTDAAVASAMFIAGNSIGGIAGRLIAGPLAEFSGSWHIGMLAVTALSLVCTILFVKYAPRAQGYVPLTKADRLSMRQEMLGVMRRAGQHLRSPLLVGLYLLAFLCMGGFVAVYNYLGAYLVGEPINLPLWVASFAFLAYLSGTFSGPLIGGFAARHGRRAMLLVTTIVAVCGLGIMLIPNTWVVIAGLIVYTGAFFGIHSVATGWAGAWPRTGRAQSTALYTLLYYLGSSVFGWAIGLFFERFGWNSVVFGVGGLYVLGIVVMLLMLPGRAREFEKAA